MFNSIAAHYDFLNHFLSLNIDKLWRKKAIRSARLEKKGLNILDLACGTGDIYKMIFKQYPYQNIVGADFSLNMMKKAHKKIKNAQLVGSDIYKPSFKYKVFDRIITAFGFRNFPDKLQALKNMYDLLKDEGLLCILELSKPENKFFGFFLTTTL